MAVTGPGPLPGEHGAVENFLPYIVVGWVVLFVSFWRGPGEVTPPVQRTLLIAAGGVTVAFVGTLLLAVLAMPAVGPN